MAHEQIFLSTVSAEFRSYRDVLRRDLDRPNVTVKVQEDWSTPEAVIIADLRAEMRRESLWIEEALEGSLRSDT